MFTTPQSTPPHLTPPHPTPSHQPLPIPPLSDQIEKSSDVVDGSSSVLFIDHSGRFGAAVKSPSGSAVNLRGFLDMVRCVAVTVAVAGGDSCRLVHIILCLP